MTYGDGGHGHEVDCSEVLERVYVFIDSELEEADSHEIQRHLDECGPCLREVDLERIVKALVARSCQERAPVELRRRVMFSIRQVQIQLSQGQPASGRLDLD